MQVVNIVSTTAFTIPRALVVKADDTESLGSRVSDYRVHLSVRALAEFFHGRVRPHQFPPTVVRSHNPAGACNIFRTGAYVQSGHRDFTSIVFTQLQKCFRLARQMKLPVLYSKIKIQNVVAFQSLGFPIDRKKLYEAHQSHADYTKETITCVRIFNKTGENKQVVLAYESGQMVITGATSETGLRKYADSFDWNAFRLNVTDAAKECLNID